MFDIDWLLSEDDWVAYRTRLDLRHKVLEEKSDTEIRKRILTKPLFENLLADLKAWPGTMLKRHNASTQLIHKLAFLADVGIKHTDANILSVIDKINFRL